MELPDQMPIDFERLREISDDDAEMQEMLVNMYLQQIREILVVLQTGIAGRDLDAVRKAAHKAVGSSATCGMNLIIAPLKKLEQLGVSEDLDTAESLLGEAESAFAKISALLESGDARNVQ